MTALKDHVPTQRPLSPETVRHLKGALPAAMTKTRRGAGGATFTYIPSNVAITIANEVFGEGGWSKTVKEIYVDKNQEGQTIGYSVLVSLIIHENGAVYEDLGYGGMTERTNRRSGQADTKELIQTADEHERARKGAVSDGLKRCLRHAGGMFGNELYEDDQDRKRMANAAIDAWVEAGKSEDEAYNIVVIPPNRKTTDVPGAVSVANIRRAQIEKEDSEQARR